MTKARRIHRPKAGSRAAILNRNAATWSLVTKLDCKFDGSITDHNSERGLTNRTNRFVSLMIIVSGLGSGRAVPTNGGERSATDRRAGQRQRCIGRVA